MIRIAIIPARAGSKRIPNKNIRLIKGEPMIGLTIKSLAKFGIFDRIIVSTDSLEIVTIAKKYGAEAPFMRPTHLADDFTGTREIIVHAIRELTINDLSLMLIACVYPTSILLQHNDLVTAFTKFEEGCWDYVFSATKPNSSPLRAFTKEVEGGVKMLFPQYVDSRSQDLQPVFVDAGMFYLATQNTWLKEKEIFQEKSTLIEIPPVRALDINTEEDLLALELIYKVFNSK